MNTMGLELPFIAANWNEGRWIAAKPSEQLVKMHKLLWNASQKKLAFRMARQHRQSIIPFNHITDSDTTAWSIWRQML